MKAKLWEAWTSHKDPALWGERDSITVNARNIDEALKKINKRLRKGHYVRKIRLLGTED